MLGTGRPRVLTCLTAYSALDTCTLALRKVAGSGVWI